MSRVFIRGYCDRPSAAPGEQMDFFVNVDEPCRFQAQVVRLVQGNADPAGPGVKEYNVDAPINGPHDGVPQRTQVGGYAEIPDDEGVLVGNAGLTVQAFVWATLPGKNQTIISRFDRSTGAGWALELEDGFPTLVVSDGKQAPTRIVSDRRLFPEVWYSIAAGFDPVSGRLLLSQQVKLNRTNSLYSNVVDLDSDSSQTLEAHVFCADAHVPLIIAGVTEAVSDGRVWVTDMFSGKIDSPKVLSGLLSGDDVDALHTGVVPTNGALAHWDFSAEITRTGITTDRVSDVSGNGLNGECVNTPDRAMTGWNWEGHEENYVYCPEQYGAIWFHEDSLDDCRWQSPISLTLPAGMKSGAYALKVTVGTYEDHIPFFVTPPRGTATAKIAVLIPTFSYLGYANSQDMQSANTAQAIMGVFSSLEDLDLELGEFPAEYGLSTYDYHTDGRGVQYSSWRRPLLSMRPRYRHEFGSLWQFPADLQLMDWMETKNFEFDVITDHDLHQEGAELLGRYNVVVTGTHPEYYSGQMLNAWEDYLASGGRAMYLAANGFIWVSSTFQHKPWVMETRKGETGTQAWRARPGEYYQESTGERGGIWRMRARAPQKVFGTGMSSHGLDISTGYIQLPDSKDPRVAWIMEGVERHEVIGDFGLVNGGAAGLEMDIIDPTLGTPPNTMLLASSSGHSVNAVLVPEEQFFPHAGMNGIEHPRVRADIVYFTTKKGGAVFTTSSMTWSGSLSHNDYENNVSAMTSNVLARFAADGPIEELV